MQTESNNKSCYREPTHDDVRRLILKALKEHEKGRLGRLIYDICKHMVLELFEKANQRGNENIYTPVFKVM